MPKLAAVERWIAAHDAKCAEMDALDKRRLAEIEELQRELHQARASCGWQPIDTAPKDGRPILIWQPDEDPYPNMGQCDDRRYAIGYRRPTEWAKNSDFGNRNASTVTPTHWMPLPEPPR